MNYERLKTCDAVRTTDWRGRVIVLPTARAFAEMQRSKPTMPEEPGWTMAPRRAWAPQPVQDRHLTKWMVRACVVALTVAGVVWAI